MYDYQKRRPFVFTESGVKMLLEIRDKVFSLCKKAGACTMEAAMTSGDSWDMLACVDYLVERGDICKRPGQFSSGQDQILIWITSRLN